MRAWAVEVNIGLAVSRSEGDTRDEATVQGEAELVVARVAEEIMQCPELVGPGALFRSVEEPRGREGRMGDCGWLRARK